MALDGELLPVVGEVMGEAEGFFTELWPVLLLFDFLLVKMCPNSFKSVVRITTGARDVLHWDSRESLIVPGATAEIYPAVRIALEHGKVEGRPILCCLL